MGRVKGQKLTEEQKETAKTFKDMKVFLKIGHGVEVSRSELEGAFFMIGTPVSDFMDEPNWPLLVKTIKDNPQLKESSGTKSDSTERRKNLLTDYGLPRLSDFGKAAIAVALVRTLGVKGVSAETRATAHKAIAENDSKAIADIFGVQMEQPATVQVRKPKSKSRK